MRDPGHANLPAQKIGPNDLLALSVYGSPEFSRTVRVASDGVIQLPMIRRAINVDGLFPNEVAAAVRTALQNEDLILDPIVAVTVVEYYSRPISVVGAVKNPVTFQAIGHMALLEAIARAGGLSPDAGSEILISRSQTARSAASSDSAQPLVQRIAVKALINGADPAANIPLFGGEEIRVPEAGKIFVVGNVRKPGAYSVQSETEVTVMKMLAMAEGLAPFATDRAFVYRSVAGAESRQEIPIELRKIVDRAEPDVRLQANDILYIPDNRGRRATVNALDRILGFGASTASGVLIWRR